MTKEQLIKAMATKSGLTQKDTEKLLNAFVDSVTEALQNNDKVQLVGFGSFEVRERAERKGKNPQTQEEILIPATKVPVFKVGKLLKEAVITK
ncbi:HU family DNA-binding protein [Caldicellulosiruptoraceae bacterium PP1]